MEKTSLLKISSLEVAFGSTSVLQNISLNLYQNEILGVVGESGSGKSITSLSILGLLKNANTSGTIMFHEKNLLEATEKQLRKIRGNKISMIFQEPMTSLNPSMTCGKQVEEILVHHDIQTKEGFKQEVIDLFNKVKLPDPTSTYNKYPHELSGGQKQRIMIAMAIACKPEVLIADEPTTALDVTVQKEIILLLKELQQETKMSIIFITHDLSLISEIADRVIVMYKGKIVESGNTIEIFNNPKHSYTKALIKARPDLNKRLSRLYTIKDVINEDVSFPEISLEQRKLNHKKIYSSSPILEVINAEKSYFKSYGLLGKYVETKAINDISFKVYPGETLGLVGESGCGKSTLANAILQLDPLHGGDILFNGQSITNLKKQALRQLRKDIQLIFQDPYSSLNPRIPVGKAIMEPMKVHGLYNSYDDRKSEAISLLEQVGLDESHFNRYPHEFSGGQRQRIGIARTIAVKPKLIICDESVSALDISVQAQVLNLLNSLKEKFGFTYIFISHDLAVVKYMSDQLMVLNKGKIEEIGDADHIYANPSSNYTQKLINAIPKGL